MKKTFLALLCVTLPYASAENKAVPAYMSKVIPRLYDACESLRKDADENLRNTQPQIIKCRNEGKIPRAAMAAFLHRFAENCVANLRAQVEPQLANPANQYVSIDWNPAEVHANYEQGFEALYARYCGGGTSL